MGNRLAKLAFIFSVSLQMSSGMCMDVEAPAIPDFPKPQCRFDIGKFLSKCQSEHPELVNVHMGNSPSDQSWNWLSILSHGHENTIEWAQANIARTKLFLSTKEAPHRVYGPHVLEPNHDFHTFLIQRLIHGVLPWLNTQPEYARDFKWCKIQLGYLYREYGLTYHANNDRRDLYLAAAYTQFSEVFSKRTTKTVAYCLASLILHDNYTPAELARDQAIEKALDYLKKAKEKAVSSGSSGTDGTRMTALEVAARPVYIRDLTASMTTPVGSEDDEHMPSENSDMDDQMEEEADGGSLTSETDDADLSDEEFDAQAFIARLPYEIRFTLSEEQILYIYDHRQNHIDSIVGDVWKVLSAEQKQSLGRNRDARYMTLTNLVTKIID